MIKQEEKFCSGIKKKKKKKSFDKLVALSVMCAAQLVFELQLPLLLLLRLPLVVVIMQ